MTRHRLLVGLPLVLLAVGCLYEKRPLLVNSDPFAAPNPLRAQRPVMQAPATEEAAKRVMEVGRKLVLANPKLGLRPLFITVGSPRPEIFHLGGGVEGYQIYISEGMVTRCKSDAELAAVLSVELGKIVQQREALMLAGKLPEQPPPISEPIGNDVTGTFGSPDGTRVMEQAKYEKQRRQPHVPASPMDLARRYLQETGYPTDALEAVAGLLREAEDHFAIENQLREPVIR